MSASSSTSLPVPAIADRGAALWRRLALFGILALVLALRLPGMALPLERDEGAYAYVAYRWLQGALPYRDVFDHKPPLIYALYVPPLLSGLPPTLAIRLWATLLCLAAVLLVYAIGRRVWEPASALIAALLFGLAGSAFDLQGLVLNTDQALVVPALLALWFALRFVEAGRSRFALALGAALAVTALIKPTAAVLAVLALLICPRSFRRAAPTLLLVALGAALVAVPVALLFALNGAWSDLVFGVVGYNRLYAAEASERWQLGPIVDLFAPFAPLVLVAVGGATLAGTQPLPNGRRQVWLVTGAALATLGAAAGSLRPFVHYYYPALPFLALLAAPCVRWLWLRSGGETRSQRLAGRAAPLMLLAVLAGPFLVQNLRLFGASAEQQAIWLYGDAGAYYFAPAPEVAQYIAAHTRPDDAVYIFAAEPQVYLLAQRRAAGRYIYDYPLLLVPGAETELRRDLAADPPALVLTYLNARPDALREDPALRDMVRLAQIGRYEIFGRP